MVILKPDLRKRKRILKSIRRNRAEQKLQLSVAALLLIMTVFILAAAAYLLHEHPTTTESTAVIIAAAVCLAAVPFFAAISIGRSVTFKRGLPYSGRANGTVYLYNDKLEYAVWRVRPNEPAAYGSKRAAYRDDDMFVYTIEKAEVTALSIADDVCAIQGKWSVSPPDWVDEEETVWRTMQEFSFLMTFEQENADQLINEWRN